MKVLYVSNSDLLGQQFNGYLLMRELNKLGHTATMAVDSKKDVDNDNVYPLGSRNRRKVNKFLAHLEKKIGIRNIFPIQSFDLFNHAWYKEADIIHLHLIHASQFFSLLHLKKISKEKKVVWSIHDPWITTGHCIYSLDCKGWMSGCKKCPYLKLNYSIPRDTAWINWRIKKNILAQKTNINLIVASKYMETILKTSAITSHLPITHIPYGIDVKTFADKDKKASKLKFGIPADSFVISFRSTPNSPYKGHQYIEEALLKISLNKSVVILTMDAKGCLDRFRGKLPIIELGWVNDQETISTFFSASDLFLMPSTAEAFGLMAVEAMACGTPVIVFDGTSLPEIVGDAGIIVPMRDSEALAKAITVVMNDEQMRERLSENGVQYVSKHFTHGKYVAAHLKLYSDILA